MDAYQQYIHKSRYARYLPEQQRRETWEETIDRYLNFWIEKQKITLEEANDMFKDIHDLDVMPSMRALMTAGEALDRDNVAGFNCSGSTDGVSGKDLLGAVDALLKKEKVPAVQLPSIGCNIKWRSENEPDYFKK